MALSQRLQIRQGQALVMTPQLMQAIKLLQLSNLDLTAYVDAELERNPLLERETEGDGERLEPEVAGIAEQGAAGEAADWSSAELDTSRSALEERLDTNL
ncbi:MAG: RNA polymerase factor sigma-54, partial [Xanthobacteraceae bacterium]